MYRLKFKVIPSCKFIIGKDFIAQMFRESRKNLPNIDINFELFNQVSLTRTTPQDLVEPDLKGETRKKYKNYIIYDFFVSN